MMDCPFDPENIAPAVGLIFVGIALFISFIFVLIKTWLNCMIFYKAGYNWAWGLLTLVPVVNIFIIFFIALADWPVRRELRRYKTPPIMQPPNP